MTRRVILPPQCVSDREMRIDDKEVRPLGLLSKKAITYHHTQTILAPQNNRRNATRGLGAM